MSPNDVNKVFKDDAETLFVDTQKQILIELKDDPLTWFPPPPMILGGVDFQKRRILWGDLDYGEKSGGT